MTADIESLVLEHLRHIRGRVDQIAEDVTDLKHRMSSLEFSASRTRADIAHGDETAARQQAALDRLAERVARIERRLELDTGS
jgi:outer membrane murein-binding lipoprotein Lpp